MKKFLLAGVATALLTGGATAADLPRRAAPPVFAPPPPIFTFTGFYAGLHSSYVFTDDQRVTTVGNNGPTTTNVNVGFRAPSIKSQVDGFGRIGGGFGFNQQLTPGNGFVVGLGFDIDWLDLDKRTGYNGTFNFGQFTPLAAPQQPGSNPSVYRQTIDYLGTVNGKVGYAFDRFFVYGTGGLAFGNVKYGADFFTTAGTTVPAVIQFSGDVGGFETGYNYGGGIQYAIPEDSFLNFFSVGRYLGLQSKAVILKAEYIHYDLGSRSVLIAGFPTAGAASYTSRFKTEGNLVRAGFDYKFSGP